MEDTTMLTYQGHYIEIWRDRDPQSPNHLDQLVQVAVEMPISDSTQSAQFPLETVRQILIAGTDDPEGCVISDGWWIFGVSCDIISRKGSEMNKLRRHRLPKSGEFCGFACRDFSGIVAISHDAVPTKDYATDVADRILEVHNRIMAGIVYGYTIYSETVCIHRRGFTCDIDRVIANAIADVDDLMAQSR